MNWIHINQSNNSGNNKQTFHAFLFNIRNYSLEVINLQLRESELNIILPRVNNFDIKQEKPWNICFIICHQHQTRSGKIRANKTQQVSFKTLYFFCENWITTYLTTTPSKTFHIFVAIFFLKSLTHEKFNRIQIFLTWNWQLIRDWPEIKLENMIHIYDVSIIDVTGVQ